MKYWVLIYWLESAPFSSKIVVTLKKGFEMTGYRKSDQDIEISLPDFNKKDVERLIDLVCSGECLIEKAAQIVSLTELCQILKLDSLQNGNLGCLVSKRGIQN